MCLAVLALDAHPRFGVVLVANRDESYARAADAAAWWPAGDGGILAGRDRDAGGTWLGVSRRGRFAFVTNVRDPAHNDPAAPTRGTLVPRVLADGAPVADAVAHAVSVGARMNGFNLLAGDLSTALWASNRVAAPRRLTAGVHGISNAALDTPWPKVVRTRDGVKAWLARGGDDIDPLFALLEDQTLAPDADLPSTGVGLERERALSAPFIASPGYGTRCSTLVLMARDGRVRFVERTHVGAAQGHPDVDVTFTVR